MASTEYCGREIDFLPDRKLKSAATLNPSVTHTDSGFKLCGSHQCAIPTEQRKM